MGRRLNRDQKRLEERRAEAGRVEEELLEDLAPVGAILRKKLSGLLSKVDQDRGGFAEDHIAVSENGTVDENGDFRVGIHRLEGVGLLLALAQLDGTISLTGLQSPVSVVRDAHGVPHITAAKLEDRFLAGATALGLDAREAVEHLALRFRTKGETDACP